MRLRAAPRGVTLIELMVVVAILGILAAIGSVAYGRYIKSGKIERLKAIAMQVQSGQERYRSRNNAYYPAAGGTKASNVAADMDQMQKLLDIPNEPPSDVIFTVISWAGGTGCAAPCDGLPHDDAKSGWAVLVTQDLDAGGAPDTTIFLSNSAPAPVLLNEGL